MTIQVNKDVKCTAVSWLFHTLPPKIFLRLCDEMSEPVKYFFINLFTCCVEYTLPFLYLKAWKLSGSSGK